MNSETNYCPPRITELSLTNLTERKMRKITLSVSCGRPTGELDSSDWVRQKGAVNANSGQFIILFSLPGSHVYPALVGRMCFEWNVLFWCHSREAKHNRDAQIWTLPLVPPQLDLKLTEVTGKPAHCYLYPAHLELSKALCHWGCPNTMSFLDNSHSQKYCKFLSEWIEGGMAPKAM